MGLNIQYVRIQTFHGELDSIKITGASMKWELYNSNPKPNTGHITIHGVSLNHKDLEDGTDLLISLLEESLEVMKLQLNKGK